MGDVALVAVGVLNLCLLVRLYTYNDKRRSTGKYWDTWDLAPYSRYDSQEYKDTDREV